MRTARIVSFTAAVASIAAVSLPAPAHAEANYAGKTIEIIVGRSPGSGTDSTARTFVKYWAKHIPGNPNVIVRNMKGTPAYNYVFEKGKPGLTATFTPYDAVSPMLKRKGFRADYRKMPFVGSLYNPSMLYISTKQIKNAADIMKIKGSVYGGQQPTQRFDLFGRITLEMLGVDYRYITGYGGAAKVLNAMRRGEVELQTIGLNLYRLSAEAPLVKTGKAIPLYHYPWPGYQETSQKIMGGIPVFDVFYKKVKGTAPSGELFDAYKWMTKVVNGMSYTMFLAPDTPPDQVDTLRAAYVKTVNDPAYQAEESKMFGFNLPFINPARGAEVLSAMYDAPQKYRDFFQKFLDEGAKHVKKKDKK